MKKEPMLDVFKQTSIDYIKNGNVQAKSKQYKVQYVGRLKQWKCSCAGFLRSGGKNECKHVTATKIRLFMEIRDSNGNV